MPEWKDTFQLYFIHRTFFRFSINCIKAVIPIRIMEMAMTKVWFMLEASVRTETTHKPSKVAAANFFFSGVYVIELTCHLMIERHFLKDISLTVFQPPYCFFFWNRSVFYIIFTILVQCREQSSKIKLLYINLDKLILW